MIPWTLAIIGLHAWCRWTGAYCHSALNEQVYRGIYVCFLPPVELISNEVILSKIDMAHTRHVFFWSVVLSRLTILRSETWYQVSLGVRLQHISLASAFSQRPHDAKITSLWRPNDVATSFWRHNNVIIASCARWVESASYMSFKWHHAFMAWVNAKCCNDLWHEARKYIVVVKYCVCSLKRKYRHLIFCHCLYRKMSFW